MSHSTGWIGVARRLLGEMPLDREERVFGVIDEHQQRRIAHRDLARQLGSDRTAGAGNQADLPAEVFAIGVRQERFDPPSEQHLLFVFRHDRHRHHRVGSAAGSSAECVAALRITRSMRRLLARASADVLGTRG